MTQSDTPRSGTPTELPSGPVEIARLVRSLRRDLVLLRDLLATAPPIPLEDEPAPPQSKLTLGSAAKWFLIANGALRPEVNIRTHDSLRRRKQ